MHVMFAGAATAATLALFNAAQSGNAEAVGASGSVQLGGQFTDLPTPAAAPSGPQIIPSGSGFGGGIEAVDEGVNDNGQTSGDIFTQNAQDQSTA